MQINIQVSRQVLMKWVAYLMDYSDHYAELSELDLTSDI